MKAIPMVMESMRSLKLEITQLKADLTTSLPPTSHISFKAMTRGLDNSSLNPHQNQQGYEESETQLHPFNFCYSSVQTPNSDLNHSHQNFPSHTYTPNNHVSTPDLNLPNYNPSFRSQIHQPYHKVQQQPSDHQIHHHHIPHCDPSQTSSSHPSPHAPVEGKAKGRENSNLNPQAIHQGRSSDLDHQHPTSHIPHSTARFTINQLPTTCNQLQQESSMDKIPVEIVPEVVIKDNLELANPKFLVRYNLQLEILHIHFHKQIKKRRRTELLVVVDVTNTSPQKEDTWQGNKGASDCMDLLPVTILPLIRPPRKPPPNLQLQSPASTPRNSHEHFIEQVEITTPGLSEIMNLINGFQQRGKDTQRAFYRTGGRRLDSGCCICKGAAATRKKTQEKRHLSSNGHRRKARERRRRRGRTWPLFRSIAGRGCSEGGTIGNLLSETDANQGISPSGRLAAIVEREPLKISWGELLRFGEEISELRS